MGKQAQLERAVARMRVRLLWLCVAAAAFMALFYREALTAAGPLSVGIFLVGDASFQLRLWAMARGAGWIGGNPAWYTTALRIQLAIGLVALVGGITLLTRTALQGTP